MFNSHLKGLTAFAIFFALCATLSSAQTMNVKIIKRQTGDTAYNYSTPGRTDTTTKTHTKCKDGTNGENCVKVTERETEYVAPTEGSYDVTGATLSLLLPDGRVAVVNCVSKMNFMSTDPHPHSKRSCRIPPVDNIQVEFKGKNAKLLWPVSVDGLKMESETYKIVALQEK